VAAAAAAAGQRSINGLGGVKPLAFGQYRELGPGFEQLMHGPALAEEAGRGRAKRRWYFITNQVAAKGVQLRLS
jgi:hypothetical protein